MTAFRFNLMLAILIAAVTAATYMATTMLQPSPPPLVVKLANMTPEQLDALDAEAAAIQAELSRAKAEVDALLECSRAATTAKAWGDCAR